MVASKIRSAVTDSGREVRRGEGKQGIANLIEILSVATGEPPEAIEAAYEGKGYGDFKADVAEAVVEMLRPIRERYLELRADEAELATILATGAERAASRWPTRRRSPRCIDAMGFRVPNSARGGRDAAAARPSRPAPSDPPVVREVLAAVYRTVPIMSSGDQHGLTRCAVVHLGGLEFTPPARLQTVHRQARIGRPVQLHHRVAHRLAHPPHLPVSALVDAQLDPARCQPRTCGGRGRPSSSSTPVRSRSSAAATGLPPPAPR